VEQDTKVILGKLAEMDARLDELAAAVTELAEKEIPEPVHATLESRIVRKGKK
jgi:tRNA(Ser,Leu) C12 N-acetylase TAN1